MDSRSSNIQKHPRGCGGRWGTWASLGGTRCPRSSLPAPLSGRIGKTEKDGSGWPGPGLWEMQRGARGALSLEADFRSPSNLPPALTYFIVLTLELLMLYALA